MNTIEKIKIFAAALLLMQALAIKGFAQSTFSDITPPPVQEIDFDAEIEKEKQADTLAQNLSFAQKNKNSKKTADKKSKERKNKNTGNENKTALKKD